MSEHTPTPWNMVKGPPAALLRKTQSYTSAPGYTIYGKEGIHTIITAMYTYSEANAQFIVKACNAHEELTTVVRETLDSLTTLRMELADPQAGEVGDLIRNLQNALNNLEG